MRAIICVIAIAAVMATGDAFADASAGQGYFSVMGTHTDDDDDRAVDRMSVRGYGESQPIADNETITGKAENRRVVLRITER